MPDAEIISIGTELTIGDITDTNSVYIAKKLSTMGINVRRITIIPDDLQLITELFETAILRSEIVISTGGLGPTIDDPTRDAIALATQRKLEFQATLWEQILKKYEHYGKKPTENNKKQAYIPYGAEPITNPKGTAPAFSLLTESYLFICLPGVPEEMIYLFDNSVTPIILHKYSDVDKTITKVLHTAGLGESKIDSLIAPFEKNINPKVGLLAHPGQTDIRITAKAKTNKIAESILRKTVDSIYQVLQEDIFGEDNESLESVVIQKLKSNSTHIRLVHKNLEGEILDSFTDMENISLFKSPEIDIYSVMQNDKNPENVITLEVDFSNDTERYILTITTFVKGKKTVHRKYFAGPDKMKVRWAKNTLLDHIRRLELK